jgi:hypothetical protein
MSLNNKTKQNKTKQNKMLFIKIIFFVFAFLILYPQIVEHYMFKLFDYDKFNFHDFIYVA